MSFVPHDFREATRLLIAWNVGAWAFLVMIALMMADRAPGGARPGRARRTRTNGCWSSSGSWRPWPPSRRSSGSWARSRISTGFSKAGHLALVGATILSAWTFLNVMFALHYAGVYFQRLSGKFRGGLDFPGHAEPGWGEFVYQAFAVGCTFASSDVNITSTRMRRICAIQGVVFFFFNAIILALTINIAANLF